MTQTTDAPVDAPADEPTGAMMDEPPRRTNSNAPQVHVHVNGANTRAGNAGRGGSRHLDGWTTTSEYIRWADEYRREQIAGHDRDLQAAAMLEQGIRSTSKWPWQLDKRSVARRAAKPLRENAAARLDMARRISASVAVLVQLKDSPQERRVHGFDPTK